MKPFSKLSNTHINVSHFSENFFLLGSQLMNLWCKVSSVIKDSFLRSWNINIIIIWHHKGADKSYIFFYNGEAALVSETLPACFRRKAICINYPRFSQKNEKFQQNLNLTTRICSSDENGFYALCLKVFAQIFPC